MKVNPNGRDPSTRLYRDEQGDLYPVRPGEKPPAGTVPVRPRPDDLRLPPAPVVRRDN